MTWYAQVWNAMTIFGAYLYIAYQLLYCTMTAAWIALAADECLNQPVQRSVLLSHFFFLYLSVTDTLDYVNSRTIIWTATLCLIYSNSVLLHRISSTLIVPLITPISCCILLLVHTVCTVWSQCPSFNIYVYLRQKHYTIDFSRTTFKTYFY